MKKLIQLINLFRIFFPSWKFFDQAGVGPKLMYQMGSNCDGSWEPVLDHMSFGISHILLNPKGNLHHAFNSLTERLLSEIGTAENTESIEASVSYQLVEQLVRAQILKKSSSPKDRFFRFKITACRPHVEDVLISGLHEV